MCLLYYLQLFEFFVKKLAILRILIRVNLMLYVLLLDSSIRWRVERYQLHVKGKFTIKDLP